jgi:carbon-monoxide dehydrogenase medium subunit
MSAFLAPSDLGGALEHLREHPGTTVLAGGTDLWPQWTAEGRRPERVLSLPLLEELRRIELAGGVLRVGAAATHADLARSGAVREACPSLAEAAATVGAVQIQNRGTIGGNLVNASPAADLPPPLAAAGASVELASAGRGARRVELAAFFRGYREIDRAPDELLTAILVPALPAGGREAFHKVGTRRAQAISKVMGACRLTFADSGAVATAGIAFGSVAPTVIRLADLERWLGGRQPDEATAVEAEQRAAAAVQPIDDLRSTAAYRAYVVGRLVRRLIYQDGRTAGEPEPGLQLMH